VIALAHSQGAHSIELESALFLKVATKLYRSLGFEIAGRSNGLVIMRLELPAHKLYAAQ